MPESSPVDRTRVQLLTLITQESLDEDYQHVAQRRASSSVGRHSRRPHWVAAAVVAAFGLLATIAAVQTSARAGVADASRESLLDQIAQRRDQAASLQERIVRLRELNVGLQDDLERVTAKQRTATSRATRLAAQTGFGAVSGPGVVITVDDAPDGEPVRDEDLALLVNGLWQARAEAIAINGKRLTVRSALRNSGAAINLNGPPPLSPPYVVSAIGDRDTLQADLLDTSTGLAFDNVAQALDFEVKMQNVDDLTLPAAPPRQLRLRSATEGTAKDNLTKRAKEPTP